MAKLLLILLSVVCLLVAPYSDDPLLNVGFSLVILIGAFHLGN